MRIYRLVRLEYADDLSGVGAFLQGGRWNHSGEFLLYTAETASLSILEVLVHLNGVSIGIRYDLVVLEVADKAIVDLRKISSLPSEWSTMEGQSITRDIGSKWIKSGRSPILKVPSVLNPLESNFLVNPRHPDLKIQMIEKTWYFYDSRLKPVNN